MKRCFGLIVVLTFCLAIPALAGLNKDIMNTTVDDFNTTYRGLRQDFLSHPMYSLKVGDLDFDCDIPHALRRLGAEGELFRVKKIKTKRDHFMVEMETRGKTRLTIRAYDRGKLTQGFLDEGLKRLLSDIFEFGDPPAPVQFVGHSESYLLHLNRCNHLPNKGLQVVFGSPEDAISAGFRECPICFSETEVLPYQGYLDYRLRGLQDARVFELVYPLSEDPELQGKLDEFGNEVLANWPMDLSGFDYDFRVVQADQPLAVSFQTGIVIVSDTMLESADADEEILFVLAHEIAHCELHLPPRSPYGSASYFNALDPAFERYWVWASHLQVTADLMAVAWFQGLPSGNRDLLRARAALAKVQYASGTTDQVGPEAGQALGLHERLWLFEPSRFQGGDLRQAFLAFDGEKDVRFEARFLGIGKDAEEDETNVYFLLTTTDYQPKPDLSDYLIRGGEIEDVAGKGGEFSVQPFLAVPGYSTIVVGETASSDYFEKFTPGLLQKGIIFGLDGVKKWKISNAEELSIAPVSAAELR